MMKYVMSVFVLAFLTGCSTVVSKYPVGLENHIIIEEEWNGTWLNENETVKIHVKDESAGIIEVAWIEHSYKGFKFESMTCQLKKGENWVYANVLEIPNEKFNGFYYWGKLKKEDNKILLWLPSAEAFRKAAEEKQIEALVEVTQSTKLKVQTTENVKLLSEPAKIVQLIERGGSEYFEWEDPVILIKTKY